VVSAASRLEPTLSPHDVAGLTSLSYRTVLEEIRRGHLAAKRVGARYVITVDAYRAWLQPDPADSPAPPARRPPSPRPSRQQAAGSVARLRAIQGGDK
jgi:excisionase family DNA binding protein